MTEVLVNDKIVRVYRSITDRAIKSWVIQQLQFTSSANTCMFLRAWMRDMDWGDAIFKDPLMKTVLLVCLSWSCGLLLMMEDNFVLNEAQNYSSDCDFIQITGNQEQTEKYVYLGCRKWAWCRFPALRSQLQEAEREAATPPFPAINYCRSAETMF